MAIDPSADALTTIENVKLLLSSSKQDPNMDDKLQLLINSYSRAIRLYTSRQFLPVETAISKKFRYEGNGYLNLPNTEVTAVTSMTLYTDLPQTSWVVLAGQNATTEAQFRLEPRNGTLEGTYLWLTLPEIGMFSPLVPEPIVTRRARASEITVLGNWGAGVVPGDVEHACMMSVANAYRNPEGFAARSLAGFSFSEMAESQVLAETGLSLPRDARALLAPYKRPSYGA